MSNDKTFCALIVDDDQSVTSLLQAILNIEGWQTYTAMDGAEAILIAQKEKIDLVLLDIMLPVMDGFEVCRIIRSRSKVPIIALSAMVQEEDKIKCLELGADDYITKPFMKNDLLARINTLLQRSRPLNATR